MSVGSDSKKACGGSSRNYKTSKLHCKSKSDRDYRCLHAWRNVL